MRQEEKPLWQELKLPPPKSEASKGKLSLVNNEVYSGLEVPSKLPFFVRLDGWAFHSLCESLRLEKPFDSRFVRCLAKTAAAFFVPFNPVLAYIFSDEINFLFTKKTTFSRVEKLDSVLAGFASTIFSAEASKTFKRVVRATFDCRCIPVKSEQISLYMIWRQAEAFRNFNNAWAQWVLIEREKLSPRATTKRLSGLKATQLRELVRKHGINVDRLPGWQSKGILLYRESYLKKGYDPAAKKTVLVERKRVRQDWDPPRFASSEGKTFLKDLLAREK